MKVRRLPVHDEYVENGEAAVLVGDKVLVLSALATTVLRVTSGTWCPVQQVADELERAHGAPPDGVDLLRATCDVMEELARLGLVELHPPDR